MSDFRDSAELDCRKSLRGLGGWRLFADCAFFAGHRAKHGTKFRVCESRTVRLAAFDLLDHKRQRIVRREKEILLKFSIQRTTFDLHVPRRSVLLFRVLGFFGLFEEVFPFGRRGHSKLFPFDRRVPTSLPSFAEDPINDQLGNVSGVVVAVETLEKALASHLLSNTSDAKSVSTFQNVWNDGDELEWILATLAEEHF